MPAEDVCVIGLIICLIMLAFSNRLLTRNIEVLFNPQTYYKSPGTE